MKKKDVCLHCGFFKLHQDKWPKWSRETHDQEAFSDLVHSTIKITAEVFTMLDRMDQMRFMRQVMDTCNELENPSVAEAIQSLKELFAMIKPNGQTKH